MQQWSSKVTNRVWVMGDAVVDLIPEGALHYLKCPGGAPANVAVGVARLGGDAAFIGRVGADPFGRFMADTLSGEGVDIGALRLDPDHRTSTVLVALDDEGERSFTFMVRPSADQFLTPDELPHFDAGQWLLTCSIALANEPVRTSCLQAMAAIKAAGGRVCFDPNLRPEVWGNSAEMLPLVREAIAQADVVKLSDEEVDFLWGCSPQEGARRLLEECGVSLAMVTLGPRGCYLQNRRGSCALTAPQVSPVDTTGAGDIFGGSALHRLLDFRVPPEELDRGGLEEIARFAVTAASLSTQHPGGIPSIPELAQVVARMGEPAPLSL